MGFSVMEIINEGQAIHGIKSILEGKDVLPVLERFLPIDAVVVGRDGLTQPYSCY